MKHRITAALATVLIATMLLGGSPAGAVTTNGEPTGDAYGNVGAIVAYFEEGGGYGVLCSGTLIAPDVFLTAAHCLVGLKQDGITIIGVTFAPEFTGGEAATAPSAKDLGIYAITGSIVHDEYLAAYEAGIEYYPPADIGVLLLAEAVPDTIIPATLPDVGQLDPLATQRGRQKTSFTMVGYGVGELSNAGGVPHYAEPAGIRRSGTGELININRGVAGDTQIVFTNNRGNDKSGTCYGDSGGALFLGDSNTIVGITSGGNNWRCLGGWGNDYRLDTPEAHEFLQPILNGESGDTSTETQPTATGAATEQQVTTGPAPVTDAAAPAASQGNGNGRGPEGAPGQADNPGQGHEASVPAAAPVVADVPAEAPVTVQQPAVADAPTEDVTEEPVSEEAPPVPEPPAGHGNPGQGNGNGQGNASGQDNGQGHGRDGAPGQAGSGG